MSYTLNIGHHTVLAVGKNETVWELIDTIYESNRVEFYKAYQNGNYKDDLAKTFYSAVTEEHIIKVMSISDWCRIHNDNRLIMELIKKGFKPVWNYFKRAQVAKELSLEGYRDQVLQKKNRLETMSEGEMYDQFIILIYLGYTLDVPVVKGRVTDAVLQYVQSIESDLLYLLQYHMTDTFKEHYIIPEHLNKARALWEKMGISQSFFNYPRTLEALIEHIIETTEDSEYKKRYGRELRQGFKTDLTLDEYSQFRHSIFFIGFTRYIGSLTKWMKINGLGEEPFHRVPITKELLEQVLYECCTMREIQQIEVDDMPLYVIAQLYIYGLCYLYKDLKHIHLDVARDKLYEEYIQKEKDIQQQADALKEKEKGMATQQKLRDARIAELEQALKEKNAQVKKQEEQLKRMQDHAQEVIALRGYVHEGQQAYVCDQMAPEEQQSKLTYLNTKRLVLFGGHPQWVAKLKEHLPDLLHVPADKLNVDLTLLDTADCVLINTSYLSHGMYYKVIGSIRNKNIPIKYIDNKNINQTVTTLYNSVHMLE